MNKRTLTPFIDILFNFLLFFICIIMLLKVTQQDAEPSFKQNVLYSIVLQWEGENDFDLWVKDSANHLVGFNRREGGDGSLLALNHDALGTTTNNKDTEGNIVSEKNEEIISVRGICIGEYITNVHLYSNRNNKPTKVSVKLLRTKPYKEVIVKELVLENAGDEKTAFRFTLDKSENYSNLNELPALIVYRNE